MEQNKINDLLIEKARSEEKAKYNKEREGWIYGLMIWLISFETLTVMSLWYSGFRWLIIIIGGVIIALVSKAYLKAKEKNQEK